MIVAKNKLPAKHTKVRPHEVNFDQFCMRKAFPLNVRYRRLE